MTCHYALCSCVVTCHLLETRRLVLEMIPKGLVLSTAVFTNIIVDGTDPPVPFDALDPSPQRRFRIDSIRDNTVAGNIHPHCVSRHLACSTQPVSRLTSQSGFQIQ
eukprot:PhF_6_TR2513/c0_g1_i1/m.4280